MCAKSYSSITLFFQIGLRRIYNCANPILYIIKIIYIWQITFVKRFVNCFSVNIFIFCTFLVLGYMLVMKLSVIWMRVSAGIYIYFFFVFVSCNIHSRFRMFRCIWHLFSLERCYAIYKN